MVYIAVVVTAERGGLPLDNKPGKMSDRQLHVSEGTTRQGKILLFVGHFDSSELALSAIMSPIRSRQKTTCVLFSDVFPPTRHCTSSSDSYLVLGQLEKTRCVVIVKETNEL